MSHTYFLIILIYLYISNTNNMKRIKYQENFICKANIKYNNKFDYSKVEYVNNHTKVCIICPIHGEFWQTPYKHLMKDRKYGCPLCGQDNSKFKTISKKEEHAENFITKAIKKHNNKYDYSKVEYVNATTKVCIICPEHGEFWQTPSSHMNGHGCPKCNNPNKIAKDKFIHKSKLLYNNIYDYSNVEYKDSEHGVIIYDKINKVFFIQTPKNHLKGKHYNINNIIEWYRINNNIEEYYKNIYEKYYDIAKRYNNIEDLYNEQKHAFIIMRKNKWLKDYTWLDIHKQPKDSVVYAYEFTNNFVYVGLTNCLARRDNQHRTRTYNSKGVLMYDGVIEHSEKYNIEIPKVKILIENITKEESGEEEIKWIKYYKDNGWNVINKNKGGSIGKIYGKTLLTEEQIIDISKNYKTMADMRKYNRSAYNYMVYNNLKLKCFPNAKLQKQKPDRIYTKELIEQTVQKCKYKKDLRNIDYSMYQYLVRHNLLYEYYPKGNYKHKNYKSL